MNPIPSPWESPPRSQEPRDDSRGASTSHTGRCAPAVGKHRPAPAPASAEGRPVGKQHENTPLLQPPALGKMVLRLGKVHLLQGACRRARPDAGVMGAFWAAAGSVHGEGEIEGCERVPGDQPGEMGAAGSHGKYVPGERVWLPQPCKQACCMGQAVQSGGMHSPPRALPERGNLVILLIGTMFKESRCQTQPRGVLLVCGPMPRGMRLSGTTQSGVKSAAQGPGAGTG